MTILTNERPLTEEQRRTVEANLALAVWMVRRQNVPAWDFDDALQDATIGLMRAVQRFDPARGTRLSTYAVAAMRNELSRGRGKREGANYRRGVSGTLDGDYVPPVSLELPVYLAGEEAATLADFVEDPAEDTERDAEAGHACDEAIATMTRACHDLVDLDIVAAIIDLGDVVGVPQVVAQLHGRSRQAIQRRLNRLLAEVRS